MGSHLPDVEGLDEVDDEGERPRPDDVAVLGREHELPGGESVGHVGNFLR